MRYPCRHRRQPLRPRPFFRWRTKRADRRQQQGRDREPLCYIAAVELRQALRQLSGRGGTPDTTLLQWHIRTHDCYRRLARETDLDVLNALAAPGWGADFIAPVPTGVSTTIEELLAEVRATPLDVAHREVAEVLECQPAAPRVEAILTGDGVTEYFADVLRAAWHALLESKRPALRAILDRDVVYRAGQLISKGWAAALNGLYPRIGWQQGHIELDSGDDWHVDPRSRGLLFIPSVFIWPGFAMTFDSPWPPALCYPARGVAALWERSDRGKSRPNSPGLHFRGRRKCWEGAARAAAGARSCSR